MLLNNLLIAGSSGFTRGIILQVIYSYTLLCISVTGACLRWGGKLWELCCLPPGLGKGCGMESEGSWA